MYIWLILWNLHLWGVCHTCSYKVCVFWNFHWHCTQTELHPQGVIFYLAPAGDSNSAGPYPYGVLTLLGSPNLYVTSYIIIISIIKRCRFCGCNSAWVQFYGYYKWYNLQKRIFSKLLVGLYFRNGYFLWYVRIVLSISNSG